MCLVGFFFFTIPQIIRQVYYINIILSKVNIMFDIELLWLKKLRVL